MVNLSFLNAVGAIDLRCFLVLSKYDEVMKPDPIRGNRGAGLGY